MCSRIKTLVNCTTRQPKASPMMSCRLIIILIFAYRVCLMAAATQAQSPATNEQPFGKSFPFVSLLMQYLSVENTERNPWYRPNTQSVRSVWLNPFFGRVTQFYCCNRLTNKNWKSILRTSLSWIWISCCFAKIYINFLLNIWIFE